MKKYVIFLICLSFTFLVIGQNQTENLKVDIEEVKVSPPEFIGIQNATAILNANNSELVKNYLKENVYCPKAAECNIEGTEIVQFTVTASGNVTDFNIINSVCKEIDKEVIRVLETTNGMWMPGLNNGEPTAMEKEVTMLFGNCKDGTFIEHFIQKASPYFEKGSTIFLVKNNPKKALRSYNVAMRYLPNDESLLMLRGLCHFALGDKESAEKDWNRIVATGGPNLAIEYDLAELNGYSEMNRIIAKK